MRERPSGTEAATYAVLRARPPIVAAASYLAVCLVVVAAAVRCTPGERAAAKADVATAKADLVQAAQKAEPILQAAHIPCVALQRAMPSSKIATACGIDEGLAAAIREGLDLYDMTRAPAATDGGMHE